MDGAVAVAVAVGAPQETRYTPPHVITKFGRYRSNRLGV